MWYRNPHRGGGRPGPGPDPERDAFARVTQVQNQVVRQGPLSTQDFSLLPQTSRLNVRTLLLPCSLVPVRGCPKPASVPGQLCAASGPPRSRRPLTPPPPSSAFRLSSRSATCLPFPVPRSPASSVTCPSLLAHRHTAYRVPCGTSHTHCHVWRVAPHRCSTQTLLSRAGQGLCPLVPERAAPVSGLGQAAGTQLVLAETPRQ